MTVLLRRATGEAYGPGDIVKAYLSHGLTTAAAVERLARTVHLDADRAALVAKFCRLATV